MRLPSLSIAAFTAWGSRGAPGGKFSVKKWEGGAARRLSSRIRFDRDRLEKPVTSPRPEEATPVLQEGFLWPMDMELPARLIWECVMWFQWVRRCGEELYFNKEGGGQLRTSRIDTTGSQPRSLPQLILPYIEASKVLSSASGSACFATSTNSCNSLMMHSTSSVLTPSSVAKILHETSA